MSLLATRIGEQAQDCLPSPRPRKAALFSPFWRLSLAKQTLRVFAQRACGQSARSTDVERVRDVAKVSPTTDQQTVQAICASAMLLYERSVRPAYTMYTLSTEYQRPPQPRIIAKSWPLRRLTATTVPMAQDTRVRPV